MPANLQSKPTISEGSVIYLTSDKRVGRGGHETDRGRKGGKDVRGNGKERQGREREGRGRGDGMEREVWIEIRLNGERMKESERGGKKRLGLETMKNRE